jgi:hypothetical protein
MKGGGQVPEQREGHHIFKPGSQAVVHYLWDFVAIAAGVFFLILFHSMIIHILIGVIMLLFGIWQFFSTRRVLGTHFVTTQDDIILVSSIGAMGLRWNEIGEVLIRERPSGMQLGRPDRLVVLTDHARKQLPLNTSVLSQEDEDFLLAQIRQKVQCPIHTVTDGIIPSRPWRR